MPELNDTNMFENLNLTQTYVKEIIRTELGFNQITKVELINKNLNIYLKNGQSFVIPMEEPFINEYSSALMSLVGNLNNNNIANAYVNSEGLLTVILDNGLKITSDFSYLNENINKITGNLTDLTTEVKTSLVASINEIINKTKDILALYDKNVEAGAGANGWTDLLVQTQNGRTQAEKNLDNVTILDFKNSNNSWTNAFTIAKNTGKTIKVPTGTYTLGDFDFAGGNWEFEKNVILRNEDNSNYWSGGLNGSWATEQTSYPPTSQNRITAPNYVYVENSTNYDSTEKRNDVMTFNNWVDRYAANAYDVVATGLTSTMQYGLRKAFQNQNASGSVSAISPVINVFAADSVAASKTGRTEITPIATGVNCASGYNQVNSNFYNDFCVAGPVNSDPYFREGFLAGASFYVRKYTPGNGIDNVGRGHDGSYGISICSVPRGGGFQGENIQTRTYPIKAGVSVVGWSGLPTTQHAAETGADNGFDVGVQIGGYGGSVWMPASAKTVRTSKFSVGMTIEDYVYAGIKISNKHPTAGALVPAILIDADSGGIQLDNFLIIKTTNGMSFFDQSTNTLLFEIKDGRIFMKLPEFNLATPGTLYKDSNGFIKVK